MKNSLFISDSLVFQCWFTSNWDIFKIYQFKNNFVKWPVVGDFKLYTIVKILLIILIVYALSDKLVAFQCPLETKI